MIAEIIASVIVVVVANLYFLGRESGRRHSRGSGREYGRESRRGELSGGGFSRGVPTEAGGARGTVRIVLLDSGEVLLSGP